VLEITVIIAGAGTLGRRTGVAVQAIRCLWRRSVGMVEIVRRVWPSAALAFGLVVTAAWIGVFGYELFKLGALVF
jgi:hypothetical protein